MTINSVLDHIQRMVDDLSIDIRGITETTSYHSEIVLTLLGDIASYMLATQAIMVALLRQTVIDPESVIDWIDIHASNGHNIDGDTDKAKTLAYYLIAKSKY